MADMKADLDGVQKAPPQIEKLEGNPGDKVEFTDVLMVANGETIADDAQHLIDLGLVDREPLAGPDLRAGCGGDVLEPDRRDRRIGLVGFGHVTGQRRMGEAAAAALRVPDAALTVRAVAPTVAPSAGVTSPRSKYPL